MLTRPTHLLRLEALVLFVAVLVVYAAFGFSWWLFAALLLVPDLSMVAYAGGPRVGARLVRAELRADPRRGLRRPRADAHAPAFRMTVDEAAAYHGAQLATFAALRLRWPTLSVGGGCCGTDRRHVERIVRVWDV